jgi:hypothetical protein
MEASSIANIVVLALTALSAVATFWQAGEARVARRDARDSLSESRTAQSASEAARDEAVRLSEEANDAFKRQALAQERANELAEAALPKPMINWQIRAINKSRYEIVNIGNVIARDALVSGAGEEPGFIDPGSTVPRDVPPQDGLDFFAMKVMGPDPRMRITWTSPDGIEETAERDIR